MLNNALLTSSALAVSLVLSASAFAADPVVAIDPVPTPVAQADSDRFCGPYAGVQAGYAWGDFDASGMMYFTDDYLDSGKNDGVSGGLYAGCNFRMGSWLAGVEADVNLLGAGYGNSNWYGTVRLRGGTTFGDTLVYATGGLAMGQLDLISGNPYLAPMLNYNPYAVIDTPVAFGYAIGAGVEHWFSDKMSWKTEYLYMDLGEVTSFSMSGMEQLATDYKAHTIRTGIAIHF
jgi:outer membrane immunogenic protein